MSTESNTAVVQRSHNASNAGDLGGIDKLTTKDTDWAAKILEQAFYTDPMLNFIYGDTINEPGKLNWFFRVTFRLAALYGDCLSTAEKDGVLMMLPPDQIKITIGKYLTKNNLNTCDKLVLKIQRDKQYGEEKTNASYL